MHPAVIQLAKDIHQAYLRDKGYRYVSRTFRYEFEGGCVISRLRGCSKFNRDDAPRWRFQIDSRILFDDLDYDPQHWPIGPQPHGRYAGGLYKIEDPDHTKPKRIADDICQLTNRLVTERKTIRRAFMARLRKRREGHDNKFVHIPRKLSPSEIAQVEEWLARQSSKLKKQAT
jgi:hypothetical protein